MKRDDLFAPFGRWTVNGGKLRQCLLLLERRAASAKCVTTACSILSPQSAIVAASARAHGLPAHVFFGGTTEAAALTRVNPRLAQFYGATLHTDSPSGRHTVTYPAAREFAASRGGIVIEYGMIETEDAEAFFGANSRQVENIPDELDNLVLTVGSGVTATGVLLGLKRYSKKINRILLVGVGPPRRTKIEALLETLGEKSPENVEYVNLFGSPDGFSYERRIEFRFGGILFHPNYEAKTARWLSENPLPGTTLFWIVGSEPCPCFLSRPNR